MIEAVLQALYGSSIGLLLYLYFGYPALLSVVAWMWPRPVLKQPCRCSVSVIVAAHDEERIIEAKIRNTFELDHPAEALQIVIASDGSTDQTVSIAQGYLPQGVILLDLPRCGKAAALNEAVSRATGEILVFTDANTMLERDSLSRLLQNLADPEVGGVCGNQEYRTTPGTDATGREEGLYWNYDKAVKSLESRTGSIFAADGALYAIRRKLYVPMRDPAMADDIAISARVVLQGFRLVYEPAARGYEEAPLRGREEFPRKVRITNHSVRALLALGHGLWLSGFYSVKLLSHKLLRHLAPVWLLTLFFSNLALAREGGAAWAVSLLGQVAFYVAGLAGWTLRSSALGRSRLLSLPYYYCFVNTAALVGVLSVAGGQRIRTWNPRSGPTAA